MPFVDALYRQYKKAPPLRFALAVAIRWEEPLTVEEKWAQGAMGPADFVAHFQNTGGRVQGVTPSRSLPAGPKKP